MRQANRGERCANCFAYLGTPPARICGKCDPASPSPPRKPVRSDRIISAYLRMEYFGGVWFCDFFEHNCATRIGRRRQIKSDEALRAMIDRGARDRDLAGKQAVDMAISNGKGGVWLALTEEQYAALK